MRPAIVMIVLGWSLGCGASRPATPVGNEAVEPGTTPAELPTRVQKSGETRVAVILDGAPVELVASISEVDDLTTLSIVVPGEGASRTIRHESPYRGPTFWVTTRGPSVVVYENYILCAGTFDEDCDNYEGHSFEWSAEIGDFDDAGTADVPIDSLE